MVEMRKCPGCERDVVWDQDVWRNYSSSSGSGVVYVCGNCADDPVIVAKIESARMKEE